MQKFAGRLRKGDRIVVEELEYDVERVESVMGGSWFNVWIVGDHLPTPFGGSEQVEVVNQHAVSEGDWARERAISRSS